MKTKFTWTLSYLVEVESTLEIENPLDSPEFKKARSGSRGRIKSLRDRKIEEFERAENLGTKAELEFKISITPRLVQSAGTPSTPIETRMYFTTGFASEMSYIQEHLEDAIREVINRLKEESRVKVIEHYETTDEQSSGFEESNDTRKVTREKRFRRISQKSESNMRKRVNPLRERRLKSENQRKKEREEGKTRLQKILRKLINDNETITKAAAARLLRIGNKTNPTSSMRNWLDCRKLNWEEEKAEAKNSFKS